MDYTGLVRKLMAWRRSEQEFYHGTPTKANADGIIREGIKSGQRSATYLANDLQYACAYANIYPRTHMEEGYYSEQYGYILVIHIKNTDFALFKAPTSREISFTSSILPDECWQFDRNLADQLTPDCSNFFDLATLYWRR